MDSIFVPLIIAVLILLSTMVKAGSNVISKFIGNNISKTITDVITDYFWWVLIGIIFISEQMHFNNTGTIAVVEIFFLGTALFAIKNLKSQKNNYMLYPYYSWDDINDVYTRKLKYRRESQLAFAKSRKRWLSTRKELEKKGIKKIKLSELDEEFLKYIRQEIEYKIAYERYEKIYLFMIQANTELLNKKKILEEIRDSSPKSGVMDIDCPFELIGEDKDAAEKEYKDEIKHEWKIE